MAGNTDRASIKSNTGSVGIKKIGHTFSGLHGNDPNAKRKGYPSEPTTVSFGK
jgi:hypothetical protein